MKKIIIVIASLIIVIGVILGMVVLVKNNTKKEYSKDEQNTISEEVNQNKEKILIAYFSYSGNTERLAGLIQENIGGEMFKIETVNDYPNDYMQTKEVAKKEQEENARPQLKNHIENIENYDKIFIGYPIWFETMPMAILTFIEENNLEEKDIIPFCTHEGSGITQSEEEIKKLLPNSNILKGIDILGNNVESNINQANILNWLVELGFEV